MLARKAPWVQSVPRSPGQSSLRGHGGHDLALAGRLTRQPEGWREAPIDPSVPGSRGASWPLPRRLLHSVGPLPQLLASPGDPPAGILARRGQSLRRTQGADGSRLREAPLGNGRSPGDVHSRMRTCEFRPSAPSKLVGWQLGLPRWRCGRRGQIRAGVVAGRRRGRRGRADCPGCLGGREQAALHGHPGPHAPRPLLRTPFGTALGGFPAPSGGQASGPHTAQHSDPSSRDLIWDGTVWRGAAAHSQGDQPWGGVRGADGVHGPI